MAASIVAASSAARIRRSRPRPGRRLRGPGAGMRLAVGRAHGLRLGSLRLAWMGRLGSGSACRSVGCWCDDGGCWDAPVWPAAARCGVRGWPAARGPEAVAAGCTAGCCAGSTGRACLRRRAGCSAPGSPERAAWGAGGAERRGRRLRWGVGTVAGRGCCAVGLLLIGVSLVWRGSAVPSLLTLLMAG